MEIILDKKAIDELSKQVTGSGGFQSYLRKLQNKFNNETQILTITDDDYEKAERYLNKYGKGGYQNILSAILKCKKS